MNHKHVGPLYVRKGSQNIIGASRMGTWFLYQSQSYFARSLGHASVTEAFRGFLC